MSIESSFGHTPHEQISDVAVSPSFATDHTVFTISDGRPLRSTDGGKHWVEIERGLTGESVAQYAFSPVDPKIMYLSTRGSGVFRSDDAGLSWRRANSGASPAYTADIVVSQSSSDVVVADDGLLGGLTRSTDSGATWTPVSGIGGAKAMTFVPGKPGNLVVGDKSGSLLVSHDDGATFARAGEAAGGASILVLAVGSNQSASTVFAGTSKGDVLVSSDAGDSWSKLGPGIPNDQITGLVPSSDYATDKTLWASTWHHGPYRSTDGAKTWKPAAKGVTTDPQADDLGFPQFGSIAIVPESGNRQLYLVGYDGLFTSSDGGARWAELQTVSE